MLSKQKVLAVTGLLGGAAVWGMIWYPYRWLEQAGMSGAFSTFVTYLVALLIGLALSSGVWRELRGAGWWGLGLTLCAGWTNLGYVLAVLHGEVMRVLLLFYLAPLWTVMLSHWLLGERLNRYGYTVIALSLAGAFVMLHRPAHGLPLPQNLAEWIGLSAGLSFAMTNVMVRRVQHLTVNFKSASVWFGTASLTLIALLGNEELVPPLSAITPQTWGLLALIGVVICATSFIVQFGLTHLPANRAIVLLLSELVFAAATSWLLAHEEMDLRETLGALLIVSASLLSGKMHPESQPSTSETAS